MVVIYIIAKITNVTIENIGIEKSKKTLENKKVDVKNIL